MAFHRQNIFPKTPQNRYHDQSLSGGTAHYYKYVLGPVKYGVVRRDGCIPIVRGMEELEEEDFFNGLNFLKLRLLW